MADVEFELASVLFNVGALHSALGSRELRNNSEVWLLHPRVSIVSVSHTEPYLL